MKKSIYSLWLMPKGKLYKKFYDVIASLAKEYRSPQFEPHITLIGGIETIEKEIFSKTEKLTRVLQPFPVKLKRVCYTDYYFRTLYIEVNKTPELTQAYKKTLTYFPGNFPETYVPHLSLMYGIFSVKVKKRIIGKLGKNFTDEFMVKGIHLFKTEKRIETWHRIKEFPFR